MKTNCFTYGNETGMDRDEKNFSDSLVNAVSGFFTSKIVDTVWVNTMGELGIDMMTDYLEMLFETGETKELAGAIRMMYLAFDVKMPDVMSAIMNSDSAELVNAFYAIFLDDFREIVMDYIEGLYRWQDRNAFEKPTAKQNGGKPHD